MVLNRQDRFSRASATGKVRERNVGPRMTRTTFTSRGLPAHLSEKTRVERWQELWGDEVGACDIAPIPDRPFEARADVAWFNEVVVAQVDATTSHYVRTAAQAAADKHDYLYMGFNRSPRPIWVRHCGRDSVINAGEMLIWSNTAAFERREQDRVSGHMIGFDRARLRALAPGIEDVIARPIAVNTPALRHLQSYADFLLRSGEHTLPGSVGVSVGAMLTDLAVLGLGGKGDVAEEAAGRGLRAKRLTDILLTIDKGFAQPGFSSEMLARSLGLSRRYVNELLAETGQSLEQRVNGLRLARAMTLLTSAEGDVLRVIDIAAASGFNDLSYFNRQFRRVYGLSPTQARGR